MIGSGYPKHKYFFIWPNRVACISGACPRERGDCETDGRSSERQEEFTWENGMYRVRTGLKST